MAAKEGPRWAVVLGASSGFGAATALALAEAGWSIFGVHLDRRSTMAQVQEVVSAIEATGVGCRFFNVNAADERKRAAVCRAIAEQLEQDGGRVGVLLHSLAFGTLLPFVPEPDDGKALQAKQLAMTLDVMANTLVYWTQDIVGPGLMGEGGRIFAMTSTGARQVSPTYGAVSAAKAALESHCRQLAFELLPRGITVNAVCAGVTITPALLKIPGHEDLIAKSLAKSPIDRLTTTADVAGAIVALTDERLHWMTGNVIGIHGGEEVIG